MMMMTGSSGLAGNKAGPTIGEKKDGPVHISVNLGARSYDIIVADGLFAKAASHLVASFPEARFAIITDDNVAALYLAPLQEQLASAGARSVALQIPAGEASKSMAEFQRLCMEILAERLERQDVIIGLGGGVVGDLAGFVAASVRRGMNFVQIPTSLLAQVDSSVGGKTGINAPYGKNLIGAFHQPGLVLCDPTLLDSLPRREFLAGYAEMVKIGLISNREYFDFLEKAWPAIFAGEGERAEAIAISCQAKATIVEEDEREAGRRALLNLGHTFAHALEAASGYDGKILIHGEAVAIGICLAFRFSQTHASCPAADYARVERHFKQAGLATTLREVDFHWPSAEELLKIMAQDKKVKRGRMSLILNHAIGQSFIAENIDILQLENFLISELTTK